jgi:hypothetical protein
MELGTKVREYQVGDIMSDWLEKFKKKLSETDIEDSILRTTMSAGFVPGATDIKHWVGTITAAAPAPQPPVYNIINPGLLTGTVIGPPAGFSYQQPPSIAQFHGTNSKEIVKINFDGSVVWAHGIEIDEAADAFAKSLTLGVEIATGITQRIKREMRDSVFNDIISIAKEKGSLTAEDLTYLLEASKIIEKLKGGKNDS